MKREILKYPDPKLSKVSEPVYVTEFDDELLALATDLRETMLAANGAGLAAPQIGILRRVIAIRGDNDDKTVPPLVLVNPVITSKSNNRKLMREGCLSFPGIFEMVMRSLKVDVDYFTPQGEYVTARFKGLQAHAIQHEVEHLDGHLLSDNMTFERTSQLMEEMRRAFTVR